MISVAHKERAAITSSVTNFPFAVLDGLLEQRARVDNIVVVSSMVISSTNLLRKDFVNPLVDQVARVRQMCNPQLNFFGIDLQGTGASILEPTPELADNFDTAGGRNTLLSGFSGNFVQFIAAKNTTQLDLIHALQPGKVQGTEGQGSQDPAIKESAE